MPFTLAHPAAVLPLVRRPFVASALVAGAVAPDLLYIGPVYRFATQGINGNFTITYTHKLTSALWLDPLIALLLLAVYNLMLKRPLIALTPAPLAARLPSPRTTPRLPSPTVLLWTVVSALVGAGTHVLWDAFTHWDGYFVQHLPGVFHASLTSSWTVSRALQYASTVVGCLILALWLYRWYLRTPPTPVTPGHHLPPWARYAVLTAAVLLAAAGAAVELSSADGDLSGETGVRLALSGLVSGVLAALGWYVVIWHLARLRRRVATL